MPTVTLDLGYREQFKELIYTPKRWSVAVCHRRAGKTVGALQKLIDRASKNNLPAPRYAYVAPTYTQAKDIAWTYLKRMLAGIPRVETSESELSVTLPNGARIRLYGAENYDRLRGLYLDGVVIDEPADLDPRAWPEVIRPALSDRQGWALFIGTPKGRNAFYETWNLAKANDDWFALMLKASETGLIPDEELASARQVLTPEQYAQEYECSFTAAIQGAYYGKEVELAESEGRITRVAHDRSTDVYASWDLGIGDMTAIWIFQIVGQEWHFLRYKEASGVGLDHYVDWIKGLPYRVHHHWLPHDAAAKELQTGQSRLDFLRNRDLDCEILARHKVDERINQARVKFNRFWFDKDGEGMARGLDCLRMYRADFDEKNKVLRPTPKHDWASHGADAFGYAIMGGRESSDKVRDLPQVSIEWVT